MFRLFSWHAQADGSGCLVVLDRRSERRVLHEVLDAVRSGESRALVVRGELGVGKTVLLDHLVEQAWGCRVERVAGVRSETELAFAGLRQLCESMLDRMERLPGPHREALSTAFGLSGGPAPDRFRVGLAVLDLLAEVACERPLVCVVDDVQWLDTASVQAVTFVARRLGVESVAVVLAVREPADVPGLAGLPELVVAGLPDEEARALLSTALVWPVDEQVRDRIVAETRGNPLALVELSRGLVQGELAGGFGPVSTARLPSRIEERFLRQLGQLGADTQRYLLVASAEPPGEPLLVWRAAQRLQIGMAAKAAAIRAGLIEIREQVLFRHPLERWAVYRAASAEDRRSAHRVLAEVTDHEADPDRRAWHAAQATAEPDEDVAADLERSAGRARERGGLAAAAAFLERAAELTSEPARRAGRALAAAHAKQQAGLPTAALGLVSVAEAGPLTPLQLAQADVLHARIAFTVRCGDALPLLLRAAGALRSSDVRLSRETCLEALSTAMAADPTGGTSPRDVAEAARSAPPAKTPPRPVDLLLDGLVARFTDGYAAGFPLVRDALRGLREHTCEEDALRWHWLACRSASLVWDFEIWDGFTADFVRLARDAGALAVLTEAMSSRILVHTLAGELEAAASLGEELDSVTEATGGPRVPYTALLVAAWRGREEEARRLTETATAEGWGRGYALGLTITGWANALLSNSLGRYDDALAAAREVGEQHAGEAGMPTWAAEVELIEAATRSGKPEQAIASLERITEVTGACGTDWGLGMTARSRALMTDGPAAEDVYCEAIERLARAGVRSELARAHLVYGEWLRREQRRTDARRHLRTAYEMFAAMGAEAFARRAARELEASGEPAPRQAAETTSELTAQEMQVVRLAREGLTNSEIAARLFLSPRTIEWHMTNIFGKLQITSRRQLRRSSSGGVDPMAQRRSSRRR
ncbi:AAA family ATPase [Pseudonocardia alaniniphila]|uniref:LuxR family transcriptional regulator n=1 Tax=Pseudonocardia alaniniphila TaxID=75291 RepID=A0ABS9TD33_9PSEU|nr:LuxR family transcriptional regulator [Pseudonocardia alaniniphila]MCH6166451.1 LuxR family transcriptional regulator [Pseudonocardia alaniniphila]